MTAEDRRAAAVLRHVQETITVVDPDGRVVFVNDATLRAFGASAEQVVGTLAQDYVHPEDRVHTAALRAQLLAQPGTSTTSVVRVRRSDGAWRHVETHGVNLLDDPDVAGLLYVTRDVEDRAQAESALLRALGAQRVVGELGLTALAVDGLADLLALAAGRVQAVLGARWVTVARTDGDGHVVLVQVGPEPAAAGARWQAGCGPLPACLAQQLADGAVVELASELTGPEGPLGVLLAHRTQGFSPTDEQFGQAVADLLAAALLRQARLDR